MMGYKQLSAMKKLNCSTTIFSINVSLPYHQPPTSRSCPKSILITEEYVATALLKLDVSKSIGIDGVSAKMLIHIALNITPSLTKNFNLTGVLMTGRLQESFRFLRLMICHCQLTIDRFQFSPLLVKSWSATFLASLGRSCSHLFKSMRFHARTVNHLRSTLNHQHVYKPWMLVMTCA